MFNVIMFSSEFMVYSDSLNGIGTGTGTGKNGSLYIMPNLHTTTYVGQGPVPILWYYISPGPSPSPIPT